MARRKNGIKGWDYFVWFLLAVTGYGLHWTNQKRVEVGYFMDSQWITWNSFFYVIFFGLVTGYVISKIIQRTNRR